MRIEIFLAASDDGGPALDLADRVDWPPGTLLQAVGVAELAIDTVGPTNRVSEQTQLVELLNDQRLADARRRAHAAAVRLRHGGREVAQEIALGRVADALISLCRASTPHLMIVDDGADRESRASVLRAASQIPCPVLLASSRGLARILIVDDGTPGARAAARFVARTWAGASVTVLQSTPGPIRTLVRDRTWPVVTLDDAPSGATVAALVAALDVDLVVLPRGPRRPLAARAKPELRQGIAAATQVSLLLI